MMEKQQFANRSRFDVELIAVTKRFAGVTAVDGVSLRIPTASYCCLLGSSGCGKTSTGQLGCDVPNAARARSIS
jgi:ABC-type oligopeptide transport system ATPase subunit